MKLAIISHTEHYKATDGTILGWGPTVSEINHLLKIFDIIYHVAMLYESDAPPSALAYSSKRVIFVALPPLGGHTMKAKAQLVLKAPEVLKIVNTTLKNVDYFQFRGPTGVGVYVIPFLMFCVKKPGWFKYAGNWNQQDPPLGYRFQRFLMRHQSRKVTINGRWINQPSQCLTFENPCLTDEELLEGSALISNKSFNGKLTCCFVGRLERPKGVERIIEAFNDLTAAQKQRIETVHLVGDGAEKKYFMTLAGKSGVPFVFHGFLSRQEVFDIYKKSQVFLMPTTASEGFPKVIAEAMNFGCIPVVSNISAIGQYVKHMETGICLNNTTSFDLQVAITELLEMNSEQFHNILVNQRSVVEKFSFNHYNDRIKTEVVS